MWAAVPADHWSLAAEFALACSQWAGQHFVLAQNTAMNSRHSPSFVASPMELWIFLVKEALQDVHNLGDSKEAREEH